MPFEVYADGIDLVVFEEFGAGAAALHLRDEVERNELMRDEAYRRRFRKDYESKFGVRVWHRDFFDADIVDCPDAAVVGKSFGEVGEERGAASRRRVPRSGARARQRRCAGAPPSPTTGPRCSRSWPASRASRWGSPMRARTCATWRSTTWACGCCGTSGTPRQAGTPFMTIERPCTGSPANSPTGTASTRAICASATAPTSSIIDPARLDDSLDAYAEERVDQYGGLSRMVNRNDETVTAVFVGGRAVFLDGGATDLVGRQRTGRFLRAAHRSPALPTEKDELTSVS